MLWIGQGFKRLASCDVTAAILISTSSDACGFVVSKRLHNLVSGFRPVNVRIATTRIRTKFYNISLICAHVPTEEKDDWAKDAFFAKLENV